MNHILALAQFDQNKVAKTIIKTDIQSVVDVF